MQNALRVLSTADYKAVGAAPGFARLKSERGHRDAIPRGVSLGFPNQQRERNNDIVVLAAAGAELNIARCGRIRLEVLKFLHSKLANGIRALIRITFR